MKIKINNLWGPLAVLISFGALFFSITNSRKTEVVQQQQPVMPVAQRATHTNDSSTITEQLQELYASLEQTRELLAALHSRQLKLEQFTKNNVQTDEGRLENQQPNQPLAKSPFDASVDSEALMKRDQHRNYLEDTLYEQELDPVWSSEMSSKINDVLSAIPGNLSDSSFIQCQSTLCMVELTVSNEEINEFMIQFNTQIAGATKHIRSFVQNRGDGKSTMNMYLTKVGHDLPSYSPNQAMPTN